MGRIRTAIAAAAVGAALAAQGAPAQTPPPQPPPPSGAPPVPPTTGPAKPGSYDETALGTIGQGEPVAPPRDEPQPPDEGAKPPREPQQSDGGQNQGGGHDQDQSGGGVRAPEPPPATAPTPPSAAAGPVFDVPSLPSTACGTTAAPPALVPIFQAAAERYGLGPQGPAILAAINQIETNFGELNHVTSPAGAVGWMQFMPATWAMYGVDADGDGVADPYDPEDAIFAAARYLRAAGMPVDTPGAIFAYNHADWYVAQVLANASCYAFGQGRTFSLTPMLPVLSCEPAPAWRDEIPPAYLSAFERAAGRYELGRRGVWALAAIARLESSFGRGMSKRQLRRSGPLGLDASEWRRFAVDGDGDGRISHASIGDSAATLSRLIWSRGDLRAGIFSHNQAAWYVTEVLDEAAALQGRCRVRTVSWPITIQATAATPINWSNVTLSNELQQGDIDGGAIDPRVLGLIGAISQQHTITISSLRSDHSMMTASGYVSNHYHGRAMDIAVVDGVPCTVTAPSAPCGVLARTLALLPAPARPTELIYCFDPDGPGPAFALADHCDHIHVGYDG
jgi:Transglycosylase SLT domain